MQRVILIILIGRKITIPMRNNTKPLNFIYLRCVESFNYIVIKEVETHRRLGTLFIRCEVGPTDYCLPSSNHKIVTTKVLIDMI